MCQTLQITVEGLAQNSLQEWSNTWGSYFLEEYWRKRRQDDMMARYRLINELNGLWNLEVQ